MKINDKTQISVQPIWGSGGIKLFHDDGSGSGSIHLDNCILFCETEKVPNKREDSVRTVVQHFR